MKNLTLGTVSLLTLSLMSCPLFMSSSHATTTEEAIESEAERANRANQFYKKGRALEKQSDYKGAQIFYEIAMDLDHSKAPYRLWILQGQNNPLLLKKSLNRGYSVTEYRMAMINLFAGSDPLIQEMINTAAKTGYSVSEINCALGTLIAEVNNVDGVKTTSKEYLFSAAKKGYGPALYVQSMSFLSLMMTNLMQEKNTLSEEQYLAKQQGFVIQTTTILEKFAAHPKVKAEIQYLIGMNFYEAKNFIPLNLEKGRKWIGQAALKGHALAQDKWARLLRQEGADESIYMSWFTKAAAQGNLSSQIVLAERGDFDAILCVAQAFQHKSLVEFCKWLGILANYPLDLKETDYDHKVKAIAEAQNLLGQHFLNQKDYAESQKWFQKAADKKDALALFNIGILYEQGLGVVQDFVQAKNYYQQAADFDLAEAQVSLGNLYLNGLGVAQKNSEETHSENQNHRIAFDLFKKAADKQNMMGQLRLAYCYDHGFGVDQDSDAAFSLYKAAADRGYDLANTLLSTSSKFSKPKAKVILDLQQEVAKTGEPLSGDFLNNYSLAKRQQVEQKEASSTPVKGEKN